MKKDYLKPAMKVVDIEPLEIMCMSLPISPDPADGSDAMSKDRFSFDEETPASDDYEW